MDEFSFIQSIKPDYYKQSSLIKGISDDAAVFRPSQQDVVTAVDTMVEGVHFSKETMAASDIGYRALAANLSDLAAMGSQPAFYLVSMVIPSEGWTKSELKEIYEGMRELASEYRIDLIGGDTVGGRELTVSVTVIGYVDQGKARYRSHARPGDVVFLSGTVGDSRAGLECIWKRMNVDSSVRYLMDRHRRPSPRVDFARALEGCSRVALNDVSDGIANEANEIAEASNVQLQIEQSDIPVSQALKDLFPNDYEEWMLSGGEDFELLGTVAKDEWPSVEKAAEVTGTPVRVIGTVTEAAGEANVLLDKNGQKQVLERTGYTHLKGKDE
ncbi:thiamine-phosphate kinase [Halobacillus fulvus]|nr:thiamine-phosphate kinase [Halobacillus fulvus]